MMRCLLFLLFLFIGLPGFSKAPLPDMIGYDTFNYHWRFQLSAQVPIRAGNPSGPHTIYRIYANPVQPSHPEVMPVYVSGCLEKVCKEYAKDEDNAETILEMTSSGINGGFNYSPSHWSGSNPYSLFWDGTGLCLNYANYITVIMHSIGIPINVRSIWSGSFPSSVPIHYYWTHNYIKYDSQGNPIPKTSFLNLWMNDHADDESFIYHAFSRYNQPIGGDKIVDPVYGVYLNWDGYKNAHTRYYYNTACENSEPPSTDPQIYDWDSNTIPTKPTPNWQTTNLNGNCEHPPVPPLSDSDIHSKYTEDAIILNSFRLHKLGLGIYADIAEYSTLGSDFWNTIRNSDSDNPGNYFEYPYGYYIEVDSTDRTFLEKLLSTYLAPEYYNMTILDSIDNRYLDKFKRKEFFFETELNNTRFRFSGCYGKFAHIFVFTDFDSKATFVAEAERFFKLPSLKSDSVSYDEERVQDHWDDFFYSYDNSDFEFKLYGYPYLRMSVAEDSVEYYIDGAILDLTVYPEEE